MRGSLGHALKTIIVRHMRFRSLSHAESEAGYHIFANFLPKQIPNATLLFDCPFVRFEQDSVRQRHKMRRQDLDDVADPRDGSASGIIDRLYEDEDEQHVHRGRAVF